MNCHSWKDESVNRPKLLRRFSNDSHSNRALLYFFQMTQLFNAHRIVLHRTSSALIYLTHTTNNENNRLQVARISRNEKSSWLPTQMPSSSCPVAPVRGMSCGKWRAHATLTSTSCRSSASTWMGITSPFGRCFTGPMPTSSFTFLRTISFDLLPGPKMPFDL